MKKSLNSSILAATSLTALTVQHQTEASTLVLTEQQLSSLTNQNQLEKTDAAVLDFSKMTPNIAEKLKTLLIDLSQFDKVRTILLPWFAKSLNIIFPTNFGQPQNNIYSRLKIVGAEVALSKDDDLSLNLEKMLDFSGKVVVDSTAVAVTELKTGLAAAKIEKNISTTSLTIPDVIESIDTAGIVEEDTKTSITIIPSTITSNETKAPFVGLPSAVIGANPSELDISRFNTFDKTVIVSGISNLEKLTVSPGSSIGTLKVTGEKEVTTNAILSKVEITSTTPAQTVVDSLTSISTSVTVQDQSAFKDKYKGLTNLDFSKIDFGSAEATAARIKEIITDSTIAPLATIESMKINNIVLDALMGKLNITNLSSFVALKKLEIISPKGMYQTTSLTSSDLPSSIEEFYSSSLVVRKGTLTSALEIDKKFNASTLDLSGLNRNGQTLTIAGSFTGSSINTLKLNPNLLTLSVSKNLITAGASKSIIVTGPNSAANGSLNQAYLQNVGTVDLRLVTGANRLNAPLDVDGNNSNLSKLYLPSAFDVTTEILSGVDNGEVTVYLSGAYSGAQILHTSYDKAILNFSGVAGTGLFQAPAGVKGLVLSNAVKGINVGAPATTNEFDLSGLTTIRQINDLPISATVFKLNNASASSAIELNLTAHTFLETVQLGGSRISKLSLPAISALTDGGEDEHLDLSSVKDLAVLNKLDELLAQGSIKTVTFPNNPASTLHINLVNTIPGLQFNNLDKIPELMLDSAYLPGSEGGMWPTVKNKTVSADWTEFFTYIMTPVPQGGINSPSIFDLSGQAIERQSQADALVTALTNLSSLNKSEIQTIIIRLDAAAADPIDLSALTNTDFSHGSLKVIIDQSTGSTATVTVPTDWNSKTKTYKSLYQFDRTESEGWTNYLNYHFASTADKGENATSLDLSAVSLTAVQWSVLIIALNSFSNLGAIITVNLKLANDYSTSPAFMTATLPNATSIVVDVTGVKNADTQVTVTGLPSVGGSLLQVEQQVVDAAEVDRTSASSWKGYFEYLLGNVSGTNYTLDLTAAAVQIHTTDHLDALIAALNDLSSNNKAKIKNIKLKLAAGDLGAGTLELNGTLNNAAGFTALTNIIVDVTGAETNASGVQKVVGFSGLTTETLVNKKAYVTNLTAVDKGAIDSWDYYLTYCLATDGIGLTNLNLSSISFANQSELTAFLSSLNAQTVDNKSSVQSIKLKLASNFSENTLDFGAIISGNTQISGLNNLISVEVGRNGANSSTPVSILYGTEINENKIIIKDSTFTGLGSFDGENAHHWLGYVRTLLGTVASGTTILDLTSHSALQMNNAKLAKFIVAINALPVSDKAKIETLKIKLASGDFGDAAADLSGLDGFTLANLVVERNNARSSADLYDPAVNVIGIGATTINDPELRTVSSTSSTNAWLGYLRFLLNEVSGTGNILNVSTFTLDSINAATAFNNALESLPSSEKIKIQTLKLSASAAVTLGTGVSGLTSLTTVIVDQTAAPTETIAIAGELANATTQKTYVTSPSIAQTNSAWNKYIDYAISSIADGGLNQTIFDLTGLTLSNTEVGQFLTALSAYAAADKVTEISLKLAAAFGSNTLTLPNDAAFTSLTGLDAFKIYRNAATNAGNLVSIDQSTWSGSVVQVIDPTTTTIVDTAEAQQWLGYLTGVLNNVASGATLDLSSIAIDDAEAVTAFNTAIANLDSALANKINILKIAVTHAADITLGTGSAGFNNLRIEFIKPGTNTVNFADGLDEKRTYLTNFTSVKMNENADWTRYLNYMLSETNNGGQHVSSLNLNSLTFADQAAVDAFFAGLDTLNGTGIYGDKADLTTLRIKLANGLTSISVGGIDTATTGLATELRVIVNPGTSTGTTHVSSHAGEVQADNLIVLESLAALSKGHCAYLAEQPAFDGTLDLRGLDLEDATLIAELNALSDDIKTKIKTINLKLKSGNFGSSTLTLGALTGFFDLTLNIDRNGAVNNTPETALVTVTNNTGHTLNLNDAEFHDMGNFENESSAHWIGYLTHELNSAPTEYTLDLSIYSALLLDSANAVSAFSCALRYLPSTLKTKVALMKIKSSTNGDFGTTNGLTFPDEATVPEYAAFDNLASIAIEYTATGLNMSAYVGNLNNTTKYTYISTPFNGMNGNDWTKFFDYQLNNTNLGGLSATDIVVNQRLSSTDLTTLLNGLASTTHKDLMQNLTLNLASDVSGNINVGVAGLTGLASVIINMNGSAAKLTPTDSFIGHTAFSSIANVNANSADSWAAYLAGQISIVNIDIREIELAEQSELTAFLTALNAEDRKNTVDTIKIKLASAYVGTNDFSVNVPSEQISGLSNLDDEGIEIHRNGGSATAVQGGDITTAKIKIVDLSADSLTDRSSNEAWRRYLTTLIEANPGAIDLSLDSDTYLRTNAHVTAFMSGLQSLSPANKSQVTSLKLKLAPGGSWSNITDLGQGLTGFSLTSFIIDVSGVTSSGEQALVGFHADLTATSRKAIISSLSSVDKDNTDSWTYYFNSTAMTSVDVSSIILNNTEATAFLAALGTGITAKANITALTLKLDPTFGAASLAFDANDEFTTLSAIAVHRNGGVDNGVPVSIAFNNTIAAVNIVDPTIADADSVLKTSASSWLAYLTDALTGTVTELDLTDDNLVLATNGQATALSAALDALDSSLKAKIGTLKVKASANVTIGSTLTSAAGFTALTAIKLDKPAANTITMSMPGTSKLHIADIAKMTKSNATEWTYYLNHLTRAGAAALDLSAVTLTLTELTALDTALNTFSTTPDNGDLLSGIHIKISGAAGGAKVNLTANLDTQTEIDTPAKFTVDVSGFTHLGSQATVDHTGGTPKTIQLTISGASDVYRNSSDSWGMYLNSLYPAGIPATTTLDLTGSSNTYLRSQADVDALMSALDDRSDRTNIDTLNVRLAPCNVGSDIIFGVGLTSFSPTMNIAATGATNNGTLISSKDIHYAGSFTSNGNTVTQAFASTVADKAEQSDWTKYLTYILSSTADGGLGHVSIKPDALTETAHLTELMNALNDLSSDLKNAAQHIHLDVSHAAFNGGLVLGTSISGLSNLQEVTYVRASAQVNATADAVGAGDFTGKLQRLRTAWNTHTLASATTMGEYLRYVLMDAAMGGIEQTVLDLTLQALDNIEDGYLYTALPNLPSELLSSITELRMNFNTSSGGTYTGITIPNLTTVKYFQTGSATFVAPSSNQSVSTTRFRALVSDVTDKTDQSQWANYIDYVLTPVNNGGLGQTTFDLSSIALTSAQAVPFLVALDAHLAAANVTALTLKLAAGFGAGSLDLNGYTHLTGLVDDNVTIHRNAAVDSGALVTILYGGRFTDEKVKIIDPETHTTADKDNTHQQWLEYLTYTINQGLTSGLLTIAPGTAFDDQAQIYLLFDAMEALDSSLKTELNTIYIDISGISTGNVYLMRTGNVALTGFSALAKVIYNRGDIDTNIDAIITSLQTALDADATLDAIPTWVRADEGAREAAIANAIADGSIRSAVAAGDAAALKSELVTQLASGITFPASNVCDADIDTAAADVDVTVDGDQKLTLATALTPFRSTGKISDIETALTTAFTNGSTTGLGTLPWLRASWGSYTNHGNVVTDVLADGYARTAMSTEGQTIADIKTAVSAKLDDMLIPYGTLAGGSALGSLGRVIFDMNLTSLTNWNDGTTVQKRDEFRLALENAIRTAIQTAWPWVTPQSVADTINTAFPSEEGFFPVPTTSGNWVEATIKQELFDRLKGIDDSNVIGFSTLKSSIPTMVDAAFTAADSGGALTDGTAAWIRPTAAIESDLKSLIKTALEGFAWYTGTATTDAADPVTAGDVANQDAVAIVSNIKQWLTDNINRPTADSIFASGVSDAVDSISLAAASTAFTTDFAGVAETLSRYRVDVNDISDKESAAQWVEYFLHQLAPAELGGLGANTIDVSSVDLGNDQVTWFLGALQDNILEAYRSNITSIKFAVDNTGGDRELNGGGKIFNDNLKIIVVVNNKPNSTFTLGTDSSGFKNLSSADLPDTIVDHRITTARTVTDPAGQWQRWLNHQLSSTLGGAGVTTIDLSSTHLFATQAQLNTFFEGLEALDGTGQANKNVLQNLELRLASDNFGDASARIGYAGTAAVTDLHANIAVTVHRNGARNGVATESALVTINHSDIDAISSVDGVTADPSGISVSDASSSAIWLAYLTDILTSVGPNWNLDLTVQALQPGTSVTEATALYHALEALNPTLKAKVATIDIKLAAGDHTTDFTINPSLSGFSNLVAFGVDATDALNGSTQTVVTFSFSNEPGSLVKKEAYVNALTSVNLDSAASWGYYLNYLKFAVGNIYSIDLYARDLYDTNQSTTQANVDAFFTALNARTDDKELVKDIYLNISGDDALNIDVGTGTAGLTGLTSVMVQRHTDNTSMFSATADVEASDLTVISSATGTLGNNGTPAQWKGYLGYLLEEVSHGGIYPGGAPVALNLTATALQINSLAVLQALEQAIAELPARLKERISALVIKTTDANVNYTTGSYEFGDAFTGSALSELNSLKVVIIESCTTGTDPVYDTDGEFSNALSIGKIVYHTTINVS